MLSPCQTFVNFKPDFPNTSSSSANLRFNDINLGTWIGVFADRDCRKRKCWQTIQLVFFSLKLMVKPKTQLFWETICCNSPVKAGWAGSGALHWWWWWPCRPSCQCGACRPGFGHDADRPRKSTIPTRWDFADSDLWLQATLACSRHLRLV